MSFVSAAVIGGASLGSAALGYFGAQKAAKTQAGFEQQGLGLQQNALAQQEAARAQLTPWITSGAGANKALSGLYGPKADYSQFTRSPDYQFAQQQGNLGLQRYENATGMALSGGALKDVSQFNQGLASQQFGNYFNRLMSLSQLGMSAAGAGASSAWQGVQGANAAAGTLGSIGQSTASGTIGGVNAFSGGINSGISNSLLYGGIKNQADQNALLQASINRSSYAPPAASTNWSGQNAPLAFPGMS
jgi:hypothetical protein